MYIYNKHCLYIINNNFLVSTPFFLLLLFSYYDLYKIGVAVSAESADEQTMGNFFSTSSSRIRVHVKDLRTGRIYSIPVSQPSTVS